VPPDARPADFPAAIYNGPKRQPDFKRRDRDYASFRTRIRDGIKGGPNFAGRMALIVFGCGTGCRSAFAADVGTGKVSSFPLGGETYTDLHLAFRADSRLVTAHWIRDKRCVRQQVVCDGAAFAMSQTLDAGNQAACDALWND
jgi:hypothetical protein